MEGLIFGILRYESCTFQPLMSFWPKSCEHRYDSLSPSPPELKIVTSCCFFFSQYLRFAVLLYNCLFYRAIHNLVLNHR